MRSFGDFLRVCLGRMNSNKSLLIRRSRLRYDVIIVTALPLTPTSIDSYQNL